MKNSGNKIRNGSSILFQRNSKSFLRALPDQQRFWNIVEPDELTLKLKIFIFSKMTGSLDDSSRDRLH